MSKIRKFIQPLLALLVLGAGAGVLLWLKGTKPEAERVEKDGEGLLVEVSTVTRRRHEVALRVQGTVMPAKRVVIQPEVNGRVVWLNDDLVPGGHVDKGDRILRIDPRDYKLQLEAQKAEVSRARLELRLEKSQQDVAEREWKKFGPDEPTEESTEGDAGTLALREPQVKTARVAVQSAQSAVDQARRNLQKTTITAPFNARVMQENVDIGQLVGPQTQVATLVGTDRFWVQVSVPIEALGHIRIPGRDGKTAGSTARVWQDVGGRRIEREGEVLRVLPDLEAGGSMARVLVGVDDPFGLEAPEDGGEREPIPLLLNAYVNVEIDAPAIDDAIEVPRVALREGDQVYVMDDEGKLRIRDVRIVWRRSDSVLVRDGLKEGERIVMSRIPTAIEGTELRLADEAEDQPAVAEADAESEPADEPPANQEKL